MDMERVEDLRWKLHCFFVSKNRSGFKPGTPEDVRFLALALAGEVGEFCNNVKKEWRGLGDENIHEAYEELGDIFSYWANLVLAMGFHLEPSMKDSLEKAAKKATALGFQLHHP